MTLIYLVRHAVTAHTGQKLSGWLPGIHLSDEGKTQAEAVAGHLSSVKFDAIYSSPIDRTLETARAIAARQGARVKVRRALGEVEYGRWTDRPLKALARTKLWRTVQGWPSGMRFPDGESIYEVQTRAVAEVESLREEHPKGTICCVSHADVIKLVAAHYLGMHIDLYQRIAISPASVTVVAVGERGPYVMSINSVHKSTEAK